MSALVSAARLVRLEAQKYYRIVKANYPQIGFIEYVANPTDWDSVAKAYANEYPSFSNVAANLLNVPHARRVGGPRSSFVMAPFLFNSPNYPSRFTDGKYGVFYAENSEEVALAESIHHYTNFMLDSSSGSGWSTDFQLLVGSISCRLHDVNAVPGALDPIDYRLSQHAGTELRNAGSDGVTWTSVRRSGGRCIGVFWPDVVSIPVLSTRYRYHWNGAHVDLIENLKTGEITGWT